MKKYLKIENLIYLMIILCPILDSTSFIYRNIFPNTTISPVTIIRPIIPIILGLYIFIKDKQQRKTLIIGGIIYLIYGLIHLYLYKNIITGISYGSVMHEAQYIINYTYMILVLYEIIYFNKQHELQKINKVLLITLIIYMLLTIISLITKTSSNTYIEGIGYKGWNLSGNSLGSILIMLECLTLPYILKTKKIIGIITIIVLGIFLTFILGTRVGLFGFYLVICFYFISNIILSFIKKSNISIKKYLIPMILIVILGISLVTIIGSNTLSRRKHLQDIEDNLYDPNTSSISHTTGDTVKFVTQIKNNEITTDLMSIPQQKAYLSMYEFANKYKIQNNNQRIQQIVYHINLIKYQKSIPLIIFGNGYEANYGEMTLEMEFIALLLNFGIIGFILFMIPFIIIDIKAIKYAFKNIKKLDIEFIMYLFTAMLAIIFSLLAGYTFFNASSMCIIVLTNILILNKMKNIQK